MNQFSPEFKASNFLLIGIDMPCVRSKTLLAPKGDGVLFGESTGHFFIYKLLQRSE